jgi:GH15 family glucan-1,4-alpha-glucosidase
LLGAILARPAGELLLKARDVDDMYHPISDYALIGNRHTCALVSRDGSVDWCCLPYLDSASSFAAILDASRGGCWRLAPVGPTSIQRGYMGASAVLRTEFEAQGGRMELIDFLPIRMGRGSELSHSALSVVRIARCLEGEVEVELEWTPRPDYARADVSLEHADGRLLARTHRDLLWLSGVPEAVRADLRGSSARARMPLRQAETLELICTWTGPDAVPSELPASRYLEETLEWWRQWAASCRIEPEVEPWRDLVLRSGMVLKLLTNERTGAMAAAPTASLPEEIGGVRNWDYRFCWVRDASLTAQAFSILGQPEDGIAFLRFLERAAAQHRDPSRIQVVYGLQGETLLTEYNLGHLDGYRDSRPVRIGNAAALQRQLDVYGELIEAAYDLLRRGASLPEGHWRWLCGIADWVCEVWHWRDRGIWEVRGPERHFTYSKLMCWVALDRALRMAEVLPAPPGTDRWRQEREAIRACILEQGFDAEQNSFVQHFESRTLDASNLLIPLVDFLPADDPRVQGTIDATLRHLTEDGLVHRYLTDETADGVGGGEGAFGICTFWMVNALALSGRTEEAHEIFAAMLARANDLGLYAEEISPQSGEFLGNYPQAFTHIGLITSAHYLGRSGSLARPGSCAV